MLTELFTGHTINLADLRAVSPSMHEQQAVSPYEARRVLYAQIYLAGGVIVRHNAYVQEISNPVDARDEAVWQEQVEQLDEQLNKLTVRWGDYEFERRLSDKKAAWFGE